MTSEEQQRLLNLFESCRDNPVRFAEKILGVSLWSKQKEIVQAVMTHDRIAVKSGHKVGKTRLCAVIALWFATMRRRGRVIMTSSSARQVKSILWREIKTLYQGSPFLKSLGGVCHDDPNSGLKFPGGSEILGFSTDQPERMAGLSGEHMLFIVDEASGVPEAIFEAIEGNRAGGARLIMISNPTQTSGTFYNAFRDPIVRALWKTYSVSSEDSPNCTGEARIPGLATKEWIDEKRIEWGPDYLKSPLYLVRVRGEFPIEGDRNVVPFSLVEKAMMREGKSSGDLYAGLDPSGEGDDESVLCVRRGLAQPTFHVFQKLDGMQLAEKAISILTETRQGDEGVTINVDSIGIGADAYNSLRRLAPKWLTVVGVKGSYAATQPNKYVLLRDQLWYGISEWLKSGGALPRDSKLETELTAVQYDLDAKGRIKIESKKELKKRIGRSPDRADALALAIYEGGSTLAEWRESIKKLAPSLKRREKATV
jgi:hypothetical protein